MIPKDQSFCHGQRVLVQGLPATIRIGNLPDGFGYPSPHAELDYDNGDLGCHVPHSLIEPNPESASEPTMSRGPFNALLAEAMPLLDANLAAAHREYMDGRIDKGAYLIVLARHTIAVNTLAEVEFPLTYALASLASLTLDLRTACRDAERFDLYDRWVSMYRAAGFTKNHSLFGFPTMPDAA